MPLDWIKVVGTPVPLLDQKEKQDRPTSAKPASVTAAVAARRPYSAKPSTTFDRASSREKRENRPRPWSAKPTVTFSTPVKQDFQDSGGLLLIQQQGVDRTWSVGADDGICSVLSKADSDLREDLVEEEDEVTYLSVTAEPDDLEQPVECASAQVDHVHNGADEDSNDYDEASKNVTAEGSDRYPSKVVEQHRQARVKTTLAESNEQDEDTGVCALRKRSFERQTRERPWTDNSTPCKIKASFYKGCDVSPTRLYRTLTGYRERSLTREQLNEQRPWSAKTFSGYKGRVRRPLSATPEAKPQQSKDTGQPYSVKAQVGSVQWTLSVDDITKFTETTRSKGDNCSRTADGRRPLSRPPNGVKANGWVKTNDGSSREHTYDGTSREITPAAGLDKNTMKWKGWTSPSRPLEEKAGPTNDPSMYKLTKAEYRRLTEQVRDVSNNMKHGRSRGYTNFRRFAGSRERQDESTPVLYRSQLAESMKAFEPKNNRRPLIPEPQPEYTRCRPVMGSRPVSVQSERRPLAAMGGQRQRPKSSIPTSGVETSPNGAAQYDTLASPCIYDLTDSDKIDSRYGDVYSINDYEDSSVSDDSDASEEGPEPGIDDKRKIPILALRPDVVDFSYATDGKRDYRKYDFDATDVTIEPCEFPYGGPDGFQTVDFKDLSKFDKDWRLMIKKRPQVKEEEYLIDRFLELERLVTKTVEWEDRGRERRRTANRRRQAESLVAKKDGRLRVQSAKYRGAKCCSDCLNQACTGNCPMKKTSAQYCVHCRQEFCDGRCVHSTYNNHSRHSPSSAESDEEEKPKPKPRPRSCVPCQRRNTAKYINAHQILLGRPRSSHSTYSQGRKTAVLKDNVKIDDPLHVHTDLVRELDRIGLDIDHVSRPNTAKGRKKFRGRPSVVPGKSYTSNRRDSIQKERVKSAPARMRRVKSAQKRPTTAN